MRAPALYPDWAMAWAKRARKAETPKQPSLGLLLRAPYFYPTLLDLDHVFSALITPDGLC